MADGVTELRAREEEVGREWEWLVGTLNEVARVRSEQGDAQAFRLLQHQALRVGHHRVQLRMKLARLESVSA